MWHRFAGKVDIEQWLVSWKKSKSGTPVFALFTCVKSHQREEKLSKAALTHLKLQGTAKHLNSAFHPAANKRNETHHQIGE